MVEVSSLPLLAGCNNPSPFVMKNGTVVVLCTWSIHAAEALEGPWRTVVGKLDINPSTRMAVPGAWEDPCVLYQFLQVSTSSCCLRFDRERQVSLAGFEWALACSLAHLHETACGTDHAELNQRPPLCAEPRGTLARVAD
eukprot:SAG31_NODE_2174_length_6257_cov_1.750244_2_plen_140_part_00